MKSNLLIHILWIEGDDHEEVCMKVKKGLDEIKGIKESFLTKDSEVSNIAALAEWEESEIPTRIEEIRKIKNVKEVDARILVPYVSQ